MWSKAWLGAAGRAGPTGPLLPGGTAAPPLPPSDARSHSLHTQPAPLPVPASLPGVFPDSLPPPPLVRSAAGQADCNCLLTVCVSSWAESVQPRLLDGALVPGPLSQAVFSSVVVLTVMVRTELSICNAWGRCSVDVCCFNPHPHSPLHSGPQSPDEVGYQQMMGSLLGGRGAAACIGGRDCSRLSPLLRDQLGLTPSSKCNTLPGHVMCVGVHFPSPRGLGRTFDIRPHPRLPVHRGNSRLCGD